LILFDGVCVFCSRWVRFVLKRDREARFRFVAIQSEAGRAMPGDGVARWRMGPLPLPRFLMPGTVTHEQIDAEGRFAFDVEISAPLVGRLVRYRGWLVRER